MNMVFKRAELTQSPGLTHDIYLYMQQGKTPWPALDAHMQHYMPIDGHPCYTYNRNCLLAHDVV